MSFFCNLHSVVYDKRTYLWSVFLKLFFLSVIKALECKLEGTEKVIHVCVKYYTFSFAFFTVVS